MLDTQAATSSFSPTCLVGDSSLHWRRKVLFAWIDSKKQLALEKYARWGSLLLGRVKLEVGRQCLVVVVGVARPLLLYKWGSEVGGNPWSSWLVM